MNVNDIPGLDWDKGGGLLPVVVQDARDGMVLMVGFMNSEALHQTLTTRRVTFFSRTKGRLWMKGETSGHVLEVVSAAADCDLDTILVQALPTGPVCHKGTPSCFPEAVPTDGVRLAFLARLERIIVQRLAQKPEGSYTAKLFAQGTSRIAQKVGEEAVEVALAAVADDDAKVVTESADLLFHLLLLLKARGLSLTDVARELEARHTEKGD